MSDGDATPKPPRLGSEMDAGERDAYAYACLAELRKRVENLPPSRQSFHHVREVRLEGSYPDAAIRLRWFDTRFEREKERSYPLWISPVTGRPPGSFEYSHGGTVRREVPEQVAMLIHVWVEEA